MDDMKSTHGYGTGHSSGESGPEGPQDLGQRASTIRDVLAVTSQGEVQIPLQEQPTSNHVVVIGNASHDNRKEHLKDPLFDEATGMARITRVMGVVLPKRDVSVQVSVKEKENPEKLLESAVNSDSFKLSERDSDNKGCQRTVKLGDNSITTDYICDQPIYELDPINSPSNFISSVPFDLLQDLNFQISNGVLSIHSFLQPCDHFKQLGAGVRISKSVFETNAEPLVETDTKTRVVEFFGCYNKGMVDQTLLSTYMLKHCNWPNGELLNDVLQPELMCANYEFVSYCSRELLSNCSYLETSSMYAKLVYWALVIDYQAECGTACAWNRFEGENTITWINLDDENLKPDELITEFSKRSIMLLQVRDFSECDYQVLLWLARGGSRVSSEAGSITPDMCYVRWPTINIALLAHGAAPEAWPVATEVTSRQLLFFASRLANSRSEHYDFCRGIYYAMDLIGVRYASSEGINYRIDSFLSLAQPKLPNPADYNFFCRLLGIRPPCDVERKRECEAWIRAEPKMRVHLAALYVAGMQVFTTTYLHSVSLSTANLIQWSTNSQFPPAAHRIMSDITSGINREAEPLGYSVPKLAFSHYTGFIVEQGLYSGGRGCTWGTHYAGFADAALCYGAFGCQKDLPPRLGSNLAIDDFLVVRPQEWGILGPNTTVDFKSTFLSNKNRRGLRSYSGDSTFHNRLRSDRPFLVVPYGIQMLNMFSQFFKKNDMVPQFIAAKYYNGLETGFDNDHRSYEAHEYVESLHVYEPCSIRTFDFSSNEIWSPAVVSSNMEERDAVCVQFWHNQKLPGVGLVLNRGSLEGLDSFFGVNFTDFWDHFKAK